MDTLRELTAGELRAELARRRISAVELARRLGWSQSYIARRVDGRVALDMDDLQRISRALDVPWTQLLPHTSTERAAVTTEYYLPTPERRTRDEVRHTPPNGGRRVFPLAGAIPQTDETAKSAYGYQPSRMTPFTGAAAATL